MRIRPQPSEAGKESTSERSILSPLLTGAARKRGSGIRFFDLLRYSQDHEKELPDFEVASEEESRERYLRIAAGTLLSDAETPNPTATSHTTVEDFYDRELIRPVRRYFAELERSTESLTEAEALALVDYAGYRGFKDEARTELPFADRRVLVTLHLLLARILGYDREGDDNLDGHGGNC